MKDLTWPILIAALGIIVAINDAAKTGRYIHIPDPMGIVVLDTRTGAVHAVKPHGENKDRKTFQVAPE